MELIAALSVLAFGIGCVWRAWATRGRHKTARLTGTTPSGTRYEITTTGYPADFAAHLRDVVEGHTPPTEPEMRRRWEARQATGQVEPPEAVQPPMRDVREYAVVAPTFLAFTAWARSHGARQGEDPGAWLTDDTRYSHIGSAADLRGGTFNDVIWLPNWSHGISPELATEYQANAAKATRKDT